MGESIKVRGFVEMEKIAFEYLNNGNWLMSKIAAVWQNLEKTRVDVKWASQIIFHLGKNIFSANAFSTKTVKNRINTNAVKMFIFSANQF